MHKMILVAALAAIGWLAFYFVKAYLGTPGSLWQRALAGARGSATVLWARFCMALGALAATLSSLADLLDAPGLKDAVQGALGDPKWVALFIVATAVVTELARRRTLDR